MQTRSSSRLLSNPSSNLTPSTNLNPKGRNRRCSKQRIEELNLDELSPPIVMMADQRTMAQLLQAPTEGYEDVIVVSVITADNFELKHGLLTLVWNKQYFGHDKEDPHAHIRYFNKITSTLKFPNVLNTSIKLMLFPFSPEGAAWIWLEKEPPRSIFTWDDLISKFINQFFPPSKTKNLRNEITNFQQRFDESFSEAWDRFKDHLRACPHHGFSKLYQLDTFYNALNSKDQDLLNSVAGVVAKVSMNTSTSGISPDVAELKDMVKALLIDKKSQNQAPATVKVVEESYVTCGGAHSYRNCPATDGNIYRDNIQEFISQASTVNYNQGNTSYHPLMMNNQNRFIQNQNQGNNFNQGPVYQPPIFQPPAYQAPAYQASAPQTQGVSKEDFLAYVKDNDAVIRNMQTQGQNMQNQLTNLTDFLTKFVNSNNASTSSSGTLPSNTIANPRSDLKAITTRSGVSYVGPQIPPPPSFLPKVVENEPEATKDTVHPTNNESTKDIQPQVVQSKYPILTSEPINFPIIEPVISPVSAPRPNQRPSIPYPSRMQDQKLRDKANDQRENFFQIFKDLNFNISFADALILMPRFGPSIKSLLTNKDKLCELARTPLNEHCSVVLLKKLLKNWETPLYLPDLTPTCMALELADRLISRSVGVAEDVHVKVGLFHFPADFVVVYFDADPRVPLILGRSFLKTRRALNDVFEGELALRVGKEAITFNLDQTSRYSANYNEIMAKRIDVIDMACEENSDFLLEEVDAFLALDDDPTSPKVDQSYLDPEGDILLLEAFLNDEPSSPPPNQGNYLPEVRKELKIYEAKSDKSLIDEPPEVELKDLPPHLEYAFLIIMANVPPNDLNVDAPTIVPAPVNPNHAPAQPVGLGDGFAPYWIGNNIPNNQNGWIEEDAEEEEEDPEEEPEDDDDDMEMDDEAEVIDLYMDDGSNNPPPPNSEDEETPPTSPVIPDADGWSMVLARVMWRLFVVVGGHGILRDKGKDMASFRAKEWCK
nr:hypothetical protein [Tanacetum cinerariifolium]